MSTANSKSSVGTSWDVPDYWAEFAILDFIDQLYLRLEDLEMSRADLAQKLGCTKPNVTKILSGERNLTLKTMAKLAGAVDRRVHLALVPKQAKALTTWDTALVGDTNVVVAFPATEQPRSGVAETLWTRSAGAADSATPSRHACG